MNFYPQSKISQICKYDNYWKPKLLRGPKFLPPKFLHPPSPLWKCSRLDDSCKILLLDKFWFISLISTPFLPPYLQILWFDDKYIIRCLLLKHRLIFLLVFLYLTRIKARQILSRLKNISLYFKGRYLIKKILFWFWANLPLLHCAILRVFDKRKLWLYHVFVRSL